MADDNRGHKYKNKETRPKREGRRPNYPLLLKELKAKHYPALDEAKKAWQQARAARADPEEVHELRQKYFDLRTEFQHQRLAIKSQCRSLRNCRVKKPVIDLASQNPWETRLPNMHSFFPTKDKNKQQSIEKRFASLTSPSLIHSLIDEILGETESFSHSVNIGAMEGIVRALGSPGKFEEMLKYILETPEVLAGVAANSDHHDLFDKAVLFKGKSGWKLRLHKFTPETFVEAQEEIHSHRNHFVSYCVQGGLTQQIWEESKDVKAIAHRARLVSHRTNVENTGEKTGEGSEEKEEEGMLKYTMYKYIYNPIVAKPEDIIEEEEEHDDEDGETKEKEEKKEGGRVFNLHECGKVDLTCVDEASANPGETYYMHPSVLHSVNGIKGGTITLVLNSKQAVSQSAFATLEPWENTCFVRQNFSSDEMAEFLNKVLTNVGDKKEEEK